MNELVERQINELFTPKDIEMLEHFEEIKSKVSVMLAERDKALKPIMEKYKEETNKNTLNVGKLKITYKAPSKRKVVDTQALKDQGLYDSFVRETDVSSSVSVSINYE